MHAPWRLIGIIGDQEKFKNWIRLLCNFDGSEVINHNESVKIRIDARITLLRLYT